jgi:hypothetical protein
MLKELYGLTDEEIKAGSSKFEPALAAAMSFAGEQGTAIATGLARNMYNAGRFIEQGDGKLVRDRIKEIQKIEELLESGFTPVDLPPLAVAAAAGKRSGTVGGNNLANWMSIQLNRLPGKDAALVKAQNDASRQQLEVALQDSLNRSALALDPDNIANYPFEGGVVSPAREGATSAARMSQEQAAAINAPNAKIKDRLAGAKEREVKAREQFPELYTGAPFSEVMTTTKAALDNVARHRLAAFEKFQKLTLPDDPETGAGALGLGNKKGSPIRMALARIGKDVKASSATRWKERDSRYWRTTPSCKRRRAACVEPVPHSGKPCTQCQGRVPGGAANRGYRHPDDERYVATKR